jgi:hypothetical protein
VRGDPRARSRRGQKTPLEADSPTTIEPWVEASREHLAAVQQEITPTARVNRQRISVAGDAGCPSMAST